MKTDQQDSANPTEWSSEDPRVVQRLDPAPAHARRPRRVMHGAEDSPAGEYPITTEAEDYVRYIDEIRNTADLLERLEPRTIRLGEAPHALHAPQAHPSHRLTDTVAILRDWANRVSLESRIALATLHKLHDNSPWTREELICELAHEFGAPVGILKRQVVDLAGCDTQLRCPSCTRGNLIPETFLTNMPIMRIAFSWCDDCNVGWPSDWSAAAGGRR